MLRLKRGCPAWSAISLLAGLLLTMPTVAVPVVQPTKAAVKKTPGGKAVRKPAAGSVRADTPAALTTTPRGDSSPAPGAPLPPPTAAAPEAVPAAGASAMSGVVQPVPPALGSSVHAATAPSAMGEEERLGAYSTNPYLAGWFRPTPPEQVPELAARQLGANAAYAWHSIVTLPAKVVDALPSIKRVFPTGERELWVANLRCPAEMATGQYYLPANALREAVNGLLQQLNESRLLPFDIQLVCS